MDFDSNTVKERLKNKGFKQEEVYFDIDFATPTNFPSPLRRHRMVLESQADAVENSYFWVIDHLKYAWGYNEFKKIKDAFSSSEMSAFFGVSEQRLSLQQEKVSNYLRGISEMIKSLFQLIQEMRKIDERLDFYDNSFDRKHDQQGAGSEITLKGVWTDNVEGGAKSPASVYGLASEVGFSTLPDLFFRVRANDINADKRVEEFGFDQVIREIIEDINKRVDTITGFNEKVKEVLKRKLTQYYVWKLRTHKELKNRRNFTLRYLKQHYETIRLYLGWVRPYLRNIKGLQNKGSITSADLVSSFEGSALELEVMCIKKRNKSSPYFPVVLANWYFRTRPSMDKYTAEGYQRGAAHTGLIEMVLRSYVWSQEDIDDFLAIRDQEDMDLLGNIDASLKDALDSLNDDLKAYLDSEENNGIVKSKTEKKKPEPLSNFKKSFEEVLAPFKGFKELADPLLGIFKSSGTSDVKEQQDTFKVYNSAKKESKLNTSLTFDNFKKSRGIPTPKGKK